MNKRIAACLFVVFALAIGWSAVFTVDLAHFAYVTRFGAHRDTIDGATDAGLHIKWPWPIETVERLDRRLRVLDMPTAELLTHDPEGQTIDKTLSLSAFVCWRIADGDGVDRFVRTVGTADQAEAVMARRITSKLGAEVGRMRLTDLISVAERPIRESKLDPLSRRLLDPGDAGERGLRDELRETYGIEVVEARLRRLNYPPQVREAIFDRIRSERNKKVADYQSKGLQLAEEIKSTAELESRTLIATAKAAEQRLRAEADAEADRLRNQAQVRDPQFYAFLRKLEEYQRILGDNKTLLLLSSHRELFDLLYKPPQPGNMTPKPTNPTSARPGSGSGS